MTQRRPQREPDRRHRELRHVSSRAGPRRAARRTPAAGVPVPASAPLSDGPSVRVRTTPTSGTASGSASQQSSSHGDSEPKTHGSGALTNAPHDHGDEQPSRALAPEPDRERPLAGAAVRLQVAHVVDHEDRAGQQADRHGEHERLPLELLDLDEVRAGDGDHAEEQEHEDLAEPLVAVRARPARVEHAGEDRRGADEQQLPAGGRDQVDAGEHGDAERDVGRPQHLARRDEPARGDADRAEAVLGVGAAARVGVVVGEVGPDLDEQGADQRGEEGEDLERALGGRQRGADEHRRDRRGQRPRPRGHQPDARGGGTLGDVHDRRGKREKSGARFAL